MDSNFLYPVGYCYFMQFTQHLETMCQNSESDSAGLQTPKNWRSATLLLRPVSLSHWKVNVFSFENITSLIEEEINTLTRSNKSQRKQYGRQPRNLNSSSNCANNSAMGQSISFHWTLISSSIKLGCSLWQSSRSLPAVSPHWHLCAGWINVRNEMSNLLPEDTFTSLQF